MTPQIFPNLPESWPKVSHASRGLTTAFSMTFFFLVIIVGQLVKRPPPSPRQKVSLHITDWATHLELQAQSRRLTGRAVELVWGEGYGRRNSIAYQHFLYIDIETKMVSVD